MTSLPTSAAASTDVVEEALWRVRAARNRVDALPVRVARLREDVRWESPAGEAFGRRVEELKATIERADQRIDDAVSSLRAARVRMLAAGELP